MIFDGACVTILVLGGLFMGLLGGANAAMRDHDIACECNCPSRRRKQHDYHGGHWYRHIDECQLKEAKTKASP